MSDVQQGLGWWIASDGKWYPPETHPSYRPPPPPSPLARPIKPTAPVKPMATPVKPKRRKLTWVILVVDLLFAFWIIGGLASVSGNCSGKTGAALEACRNGTAAGATIGVALIVVFAAAVNVILGVIWFVTRPSR